MEKFFICHCPSDLKNGKHGFFHLVPIDCVKTKREAEATRRYIRKEENKYRAYQKSHA